MINILKICQLVLVTLVLSIFNFNVNADDSTFTTFGDYKVLHTVFNSSFIKPEIASAYNLTRGKDHALVNIALIKSTDTGQSYGLPAEVSGNVANLMQQQKSLNFIEIKEQDTVYYLADLRFDHEEVLHFTINVKADGRDYEIKFSKKLYVE